MSIEGTSFGCREDALCSPAPSESGGGKELRSDHLPKGPPAQEYSPISAKYNTNPELEINKNGMVAHAVTIC